MSDAILLVLQRADVAVSIVQRCQRSRDTRATTLGKRVRTIVSDSCPEDSARSASDACEVFIMSHKIAFVAFTIAMASVGTALAADQTVPGAGNAAAVALANKSPIVRSARWFLSARGKQVPKSGAELPHR